ncbi:MAG TPA: ATP-binding protein [Gammaproteobacteria bacterium]
MQPHFPRKRRLTFESRTLAFSLLAGLPALIAVAILLWRTDISLFSALLLLAVLVISWLAFAFSARNDVVFHLNTLANLLEALREGDYSLRGRRSRDRDALGGVFLEVNQLGETLRRQRFEAREASTLLNKIIGEIDIAVLAFDGARYVILANPAAERLFRMRDLSGRSADALGVTDLLEHRSRRIEAREFPSGGGRWDVWTGSFRESGLPHHLLVISNLSRALREEERKAWRRLVRVMGHELNNSLAPIKSMAALLHERSLRELEPGELKTDLVESLDVIGQRAESLNRFMSAYAKLAKLPAPRRERVGLRKLVENVAAMDGAGHIRIEGEDVTVSVDPDQLSQLLINIVRNARDAAGADGDIRVCWERREGLLYLDVLDNGPGISGTENLFVPFFTTKPHGSGIGLALSRQIAEAHDGSLGLSNREEGQGCRARLILPMG